MNKFTKTIAGIVAVVAFVAVAATSASAATFTRNLTVGSTGADVTALQTWLNAKGYLTVAPTGYFGNLTKAAVAAFQTANGITPAAGYFGPISQARWEVVAAGSTGGSTSTVPGCTAGAMYSSTTGAACTTGSTGGTGSTGSSDLAGTDGSISDVSELSQYNNEDVGESENDVKVLGFEVEASNDGDIAIRSAKVSVTITNASGSDNLDDYVDAVKVMMGSKEVGSADAADFSEGASGVWSKTITLSNSVVKSDETEKFYVTIDAAGSFDSGDIDSEVATVALVNLRYEDGSGVVSTDDSTGDLDAGVSTTADFVSFSTSADTELKFSTDTSTPEGVVLVSDTSDTDNVVVLKGKVKVDGTSDVLLDELPVTLTSTGSGIVGITSSLILTIDGSDYSETVSTSTIDTLAVTGLTGSVVFDNLDITLEAGKTYSYSISADINDIDTGFAEGATLLASVTGTNVDYVDAENEEGDQLTDDTEKTGTSIGETQEFRTEGIAVSLVSTEAQAFTVDAVDNDRVELTIKFKVEAFGADAYIPSFMTPTTGNTNATTGTGSSSTTPTTASGVAFHVQSSDTDLTIARLGGSTLTSTADEQTNSFLVQEGGSGETFTLRVVATNTGTSALDSASVRALLAGINFADTDSATGDYVYTLNLDDYKTAYATIAD